MKNVLATRLIRESKYKIPAVVVCTLAVAACATSWVQWEYASGNRYSTLSDGVTLLLEDGHTIMVDHLVTHGSSPQNTSALRLLDGDGNVVLERSYDSGDGQDLYRFNADQALTLPNGEIFWSDCAGKNYRLNPQTGDVANLPVMMGGTGYGLCLKDHERLADGRLLLAAELVDEGRVSHGYAMLQVDAEGNATSPVALEVDGAASISEVISIHPEAGGNTGVLVRTGGSEGVYILLRVDAAFHRLDQIVVSSDRYLRPVLELNDNGDYLVRTEAGVRRYDALSAVWSEIPVTLTAGTVTMSRTPVGGILVSSFPASVGERSSVQVTYIDADSVVEWQQSYAIPETKAGFLSSPTLVVAADGKFALSYQYHRYINNGTYIAEGTSGNLLYPVWTGYHQNFVHVVDVAGKQINKTALPLAKESIVRDFEAFIDEGASCQSGVVVNQVKFISDSMINLAGYRTCVDGEIWGEYNTNVSETALRLAMP